MIRVNELHGIGHRIPACEICWHSTSFFSLALSMACDSRQAGSMTTGTSDELR